MTDQELKELVASLAVSHAKTDKLFDKIAKENSQTQIEISKKFKETDELLDKIAKENKRENKKLRQQIGGLGNKFGSFTEGMAFPSMSKILRKKFGMEFIGTRVTRSNNGKKLELDILAYANSKLNTAIIVEVKSHARPEDLQQILKILTNFPKVFPEHADKKLYAILAVVDISDNLREKLHKKGIYLAMIHDEHFKLLVPANFHAKSFSS